MNLDIISKTFRDDAFKPHRSNLKPPRKTPFKRALLNLICDIKTLNERFDLSSQLIHDYKKFEIALKQVYDLERILRRIALKKLHPLELDYLSTSLEAILGILKEAELKKVPTPKNLFDESEALLRMLQSTFVLDVCAKFRKDQINENLFVKGVFPQIDKIEQSKAERFSALEQIAQNIESFFEESNRTTISIEWLESEGHYISISKNRFALIEEKLMQSFITINDRTTSSKTLPLGILKTA